MNITCKYIQSTTTNNIILLFKFKYIHVHVNTSNESKGPVQSMSPHLTQICPGYTIGLAPIDHQGLGLSCC